MMNGAPKRSETIPPLGRASESRWSGESSRLPATTPGPQYGHQPQDSMSSWRGWEDATGLDDDLEPPPRRHGIMMHANHSVPSLRPEPIKSAAPPLPTSDDLSLDRLRLADEAFTPPARAPSAPKAPGLPSNPAATRDSTGSVGGAAPHLPAATPSHLRKDSTNSTRSSQRNVPITDGEDRPISVASLPGSEDPYGGVGEGGETQLNAMSQPPPPPPQTGQFAFAGGPGGYGYLPPGQPPMGGGYPSEYGHGGLHPMYQQGGPPPPGFQGYSGPPPQMMQGGPQGYYGAPPPGQYFAPPGQMGYPPGSYGMGGPGFDPYSGLQRAPSVASSVLSGGGFPGGLARSGTSMSSIPPSMAARRERANDSPRTMISKASIDEYRNRIKNDPDPEAHFNFAKFLIEAAKKLASGGAAGDDKAIRKYRDALLQESLKLIKRLAMQGVGLGKPAYADAQFFLANCLGNGSLGLQVDHEKAYNLYVQASKQNHPAATYRTAVCNELGAGTRKDANRAVLFYRKASALGDTAGMYKLGMVLLKGLLGQQRNPKEALLWLKRAAQQADDDNPHALHELAMLYEKPPPADPGPQAGPLVPHDEAYARELYTQAAQLGYAPSQNKLGSCYEYGSLTCPIDPRRSIAWYTRAAGRGDAESELALSGWYLTGSDAVLKQSDSEAYLWARRAANKGLPKAEYAVGYYSEVGIGVRQDLDEAKRWYMRAAAQGNKRAMQRLTELKKMGAQRGAKGAARPTREQAAGECVIA